MRWDRNIRIKGIINFLFSYRTLSLAGMKPKEKALSNQIVSVESLVYYISSYTRGSCLQPKMASLWGGAFKTKSNVSFPGFGNASELILCQQMFCRATSKQKEKLSEKRNYLGDLLLRLRPDNHKPIWVTVCDNKPRHKDVERYSAVKSVAYLQTECRLSWEKPPWIQL